MKKLILVFILSLAIPLAYASTWYTNITYYSSVTNPANLMNQDTNWQQLVTWYTNEYLADLGITNVQAGTGISVAQSINIATVSLDSASIASLALADTSLQTNDNVSALSNDSGYVTKVDTPVNNQIGIWTGNGTLKGSTKLTFSGNTFALDGNMTVTGTVDGVDISAWIDQDVSQDASPTFNSLTITNNILGTPSCTNVSPTGTQLLNYQAFTNFMAVYETYADIGTRGTDAPMDLTTSFAIITGLTTFVESGLLTVTDATNINVTGAGDYAIDVDGSFEKAGVGTVVVNVHIFTNGVDSGIGITRSFGSQAEQGSFGGGGIVTLPAGCDITCQAKVDAGTETITFEHLTFAVERKK